MSAALAEGADARRLETALRVAAVKALREHGIDLAGPQRHEDLRELEGLRKELFGAERRAHARGQATSARRARRRRRTELRDASPQR